MQRERGEDSTGKKHMGDLKHCAGILCMPFSGLEVPAGMLPTETGEQHVFNQPWFFCMDKSDSWPPNCLFVYANHVLCPFPGHHQLHVQNAGMKTWRNLELKVNNYYYLVMIKD